MSEAATQAIFEEVDGDMAERMIEVNGVELCTEPFGDPADRPVLLIQGVGASMLWWDEGLCRTLSGAGCFVIRYDHRDLGRSVTYGRGHPGYTGADLVADAAGVLDAYGIARTHVVGVSAGGAFAQLLALEFPDRVRSLVLISTSAATPGDRELPAPTDRFGRFFLDATVDWSDRDSVVGYVVGYCRMLAGDQRTFDEEYVRALVRHEVERARDFAARRNHDLLTDGESPSAPLSSITAPTLVIHGGADPMFPFEHGQALAHEIPDASLIRLDGAGHGIDPEDRDTIAAAIIDHTAAADPAGRG
ncbi:MAG: alpha/beta hydrolase [Solirubrobacterales bacterium]|nr:alpha/beta hydrolase [Solirubrobacterales bacterium]MBV9167810.1 alpha/beta hydrolase [Solirubrobacterales bacterium]MBV9536428.1 alpha/beta hydrolase [Solirubrobacterales bacterium]